MAPALAIIEAMPKDAEIVFIGRKQAFEGDSAVSLEYEEITQRGIEFVILPTGRLQRSITRHTLPSLLRLPKSFQTARGILQEIRPDIVLSFGGYIGLPVVIAASTLKIPSVIHEQTTRAGFANKLSARFASTICISWESSRQYFPTSKSVLTGNPLRKEILQARREKKKTDIPRIYVTGGSAGSHAMNVLVEKYLKELTALSVIIHQTGDTREFGDFARLSKLRETLPPELRSRYKVEKFLFSKEAAEVMASSDLVVSRSGINTISELIYFERPTLCIPLPTGQKGEQEENAELLTALGLGRVLFQQKADDFFLSQIKEMLERRSTFYLNDPSQKERFSTAADTIVRILSDVAKKTSNEKI
ncbi:MAG: UDP-N-acetylglucosamine--N-acetylmuramyl-(pentapeptide) pyrophosphoryl-undecaprenol N-acetylglucosamine transferase [Candidatus Levybacteria bacterium]|nr:UDP-N-acetylglucosamine--N-acetylmuramyl-(pentapeptide) pyrophosphoryl-undecaprenol N-acetylglucosamine transferase [Candidatus Levybacteria bacterium]